MQQGISIVIVSYNVEDSLQRCLLSYTKALGNDQDEIIVVDNHSTDQTVQVIENNFPHVHLIKNVNNGGYSRGCNQGYKISKNNLIIFSNGDIMVPKNFLEIVRLKMDTLPYCGILSPQLKTARGDIIQTCWSRELSFVGEFIASFLSPFRVAKYQFIKKLVIARQKYQRVVPIVVGACMIVRRSMLDMIGGMDENFELYFEDADLCCRCRKKGYQVIFSPDLTAYHELGQSGKHSSRKIQLIYRQSQIYYYRQHNSILELWLLKIYLFFKFVIWRQIWRDHNFFKHFLNILLEKKYFRLNDEFIKN